MNKREMILKELKKKMEYMKTKTSYNVAIMFLQGSQNYGLDCYSEDYQSDFDVKCFVVPSLDNLLNDNNFINDEIQMEDNSLISIKDIRTLPDLLYKMNPTYLELLYTPYFLTNNEYHRTMTLLLNKNIRKIRENICNRDVTRFLKCLCGTLNERYKAFDKVTPTSSKVLETYGYNPKQFHHLVRTAYLINEVIRLDGKVNFESLMSLDFLTKGQKKNLLLYKTNPLPYEEATRLADDYYTKASNAATEYLKTVNQKEDTETSKEVNRLVDTYVSNCVKIDVVQTIKAANDKADKNKKKKK